MRKKLINIDNLSEVVKVYDGMTVMVAGFLGVGTSEILIDFLLNSGVKDLKVIVNDTSYPRKGVARLIEAKVVKKLICTHIGTNPETQRQFGSGELEIEFSPQGTLLERIRAKGTGLGGILTPVGVGTLIEEGKQKITLNDKEYLLELPLGADLAIIKAKQADRFGNLMYHGTACNFNPVMCLAADLVIAEAEEVVEIGKIDPDRVGTPGILVDYIITSGGR